MTSEQYILSQLQMVLEATADAVQVIALLVFLGVLVLLVVALFVIVVIHVMRSTGDEGEAREARMVTSESTEAEKRRTGPGSGALPRLQTAVSTHRGGIGWRPHRGA